ncbi:MAG: hypothetical protein Ta2A_07660 [Treponemataceae bacterium]|nr:MAG: hypothetical protein Ta2A_07660 [Treponemataceae bacterium]
MKHEYLVYVNDDPARIASSNMVNPAEVATGIIHGDVQTKAAKSYLREGSFDFDKANAFYMGNDPNEKNHASAVFGDGEGHTLTVVDVEEFVNPFLELEKEE